LWLKGNVKSINNKKDGKEIKDRKCWERKYRYRQKK
jgi:hypothetical protein